METIIDTVTADSLEIGDTTVHGIVTDIDNSDEDFVLVYIDYDEVPYTWEPDDMIDLYGIVYAEVV